MMRWMLLQHHIHVVIAMRLMIVLGITKMCYVHYENNGVTYREAIRKVLAVNGLCLPDENKQLELNFE